MAAPGPKLGPLVRRAVHRGAALWLVASCQFVGAMIVVQLGWGRSHPYSLTGNYISDLGNTACGYFPSGSSTYVCSPWHVVFNVSVIVLGLLVVLGATLVRTAFPARRSSTVGLTLVVLAGLGAIAVGLWPENVNGTIHDAASAVAFVGGGLGLAILAVAMFRDTRWDGYRAYSLFSGLVALVASGLFEGQVYGPLGVGGVERLIVAPLLLWLVIAPIHLLRIPRYAPSRLPGAPGS